MSANLCPVKNFIKPNKPSVCTYLRSLEANSKLVSPHHHVKRPARNTNDICPNILSMIGNTPMVKLANISNDYKLECNFYAKCEYFNPSGSVKDRIALRMIEEAEREGRIKPGDYIIEPSSGNTGLSLAMKCAVKGYKCIIVMPEKMSKEKSDVLKALGAQVVRTPGAPFDAQHSNFMEAQRIKQRLNEQNPGCAHVLDQYTNAYNAIAHYDSTAEEMLNQMNDKIDLLVTAAGSGGTISGLARKIKERCPNCIIVGVDPVGSAMAYPESLNKVEGSSFYEMEGMGHDFLPTVLDRTQIDAWVKSKDKDSFEMSRQLIKREGLLCGGSSGAVTYCAIEAIKKYNIKENQNVVVLLPDSIRNYMTKHLSDDWMIARGFMDAPIEDTTQWWSQVPISNMKKFAKPVEEFLVSPETTISEALQILKEKSIDSLIEISDNKLKSLITKKSIMAKLTSGLADPSDSVTKAALDKFIMLKSNDKVRKLQSCLESEGYAIVVNQNENDAKPSIKNVFGILNMDTFLEFIATKNSSSNANVNTVTAKVKELSLNKMEPSFVKIQENPEILHNGDELRARLKSVS